MDPLKWNSSFSVGITKLDEQHRQIIGVINGLIESLEHPFEPMPLSKILGQLSEYVHVHFETEERLLIEQGYPELARQKGEHKAFKRKIATFCMDALGEQESVPVEILDYLKTWWNEHILEEDMKYRGFLKDRGLV
jgi:hemerythrin-like metal-binding protein